MKKILLVLALLTLSNTASASVIDTLRAGNWVEISGSSMNGAGVFPSPSPFGGTGNGGDFSALMTAWCGGAFDTKRNRLYIFGGGDGDYAGNEVYYYQVDSLIWRRLTNPPTLAQDSSVYFLTIAANNPLSAYWRNLHPDVYADSTPRSVHSYDGLEYLPKQDRLVTWLGSSYSGGGAHGALWSFDPAARTWTRKARARDSFGNIVTDAALGIEAVTGYDPVTGHLFGTSNQNGVYEYDPVADTWTARTNNSGNSIGPGIGDMTGAFDPVRRRFIAIGFGDGGPPNGRVYSWDMSTAGSDKIRKRLICKGDTAIVHTRYPSTFYDPVADRIAVYNGGKDMYYMSFSAVGDTAIFVKYSNPLTGAPPQRVDGSGDPFGDFGKFQYIPSRNLYMRVDRITNNVWFYKPPVISRVDMQLRKWRSKRLPAVSTGPGPFGSKHMRIAQNGVNNRLYFFGGDYDSPGYLDSGRQEVYSYAPLDSSWVQEHGFCPVGTESIPRHPDEMGWTWDSRRNKFWAIPGYMGAEQLTDCDTSLTKRWDTFTFNTTTKLWTRRSDVPVNPFTATIGDDGFAVYDSLRDEITQFVYTGNWKATRLSLATNTWAQTNFSQNADVAKEYACYDKVGRKLYVVDAYAGTSGGVYGQGHQRLLVYDMDTFAFDTLAAVPGGVPLGRAQTHPVWDSVNKVILWLDWCCDNDNSTSRMLIYHPDTNTWETESAQLPDGRYAFGNTTAFDANQNLLIAYGGVPQDADSSFFVYRYGNGDGAGFSATAGGASPGATVSAISGNTTEAGGTATFTIVLNALPTASVSIALSSSNTAEGTISPSSVTFTTANWDAPVTVTLTGVNDAVDDGDVSYTAVTGTCTGASEYTSINPSDVTVVNTDNDTKGITVSAISGNTTEAGGTATFTIHLDSQPTASVSIGLTSDDTTEGTISSSSITFTTGNYATNQTLTMTGVDDALTDGNITYHAVTAAATGGDYAGINAADVTVINVDNDTPGPATTTGHIVSPDSMRANKGLRVGQNLVSKILRASATLDFNLTSVTCQDLDVTVAGAAEGDEVILGVPQGSLTTDITFSAWVKAGGGVVTVRACDGALSGNPASGTFKVTVIQ